MTIIDPFDLAPDFELATTNVLEDLATMQVFVSIVDEETNVAVNVTATMQGLSGSFNRIFFTFSGPKLIEGKYYALKVFDPNINGLCINSSKIFVTAQNDPEIYKIYNDYLAPVDGSNEYITV